MLENVSLITCNGVDYDLPLLSHHIEHYIKLGVHTKNYLLILQSNLKSNNNLLKAERIARRYNVKPIYTWVGEYSSQTMHNTREKILGRNPCRWVIHADADEFHSYPGELGHILYTQEQKGCNAIQGVFTDRLSSDGSLNEIVDQSPICYQFPVLANANSLWFTPSNHPASGVVKMMAYRYGLRTTRGGHQAVGKKIKYAMSMDLAKHPKIMKTSWREQCPYQVHHFKWHKNVSDKLERRIKSYKKFGFKWWRTSQKFIDYYNTHKKINFKSIELYEDQTDPLQI